MKLRSWRSVCRVGETWLPEWSAGAGGMERYSKEPAGVYVDAGVVLRIAFDIPTALGTRGNLKFKIEHCKDRKKGFNLGGWIAIFN